MKIGNLEVYGVIYKIRNKINNKLYIGQTTRDTGFNGRYETSGYGIERVYNYHLQQKKYGYGYNDHLLRSIEKYGFLNFEVDEIFDVAYSEDELNKLEYMYIKIYNLTNKNFGYNKKDGGDNYCKTTNTTIKTNKKLCKPVYCKTFNTSFESQAEASRYYGICDRLIQNRMKNNKPVLINGLETEWRYIDNKKSFTTQKAILCLNDMKIYCKQNQAEEYYNISVSTMNNRCNGKFKNIKDGLFFMYVNDYYDKLENLTTEDNKQYIFNKFYKYKNNIYREEKRKLNKKNIFLNEESIINNIKLLHNKMSYKEIKDFMNKNYDIDFHISENDIKNKLKEDNK